MNTHSQMLAATKDAFQSRIYDRARKPRRKQAVRLLQNFVYDKRPDLATGLLLCSGTDRDWDMEAEFRREAVNYIYEGMGLGWLAWVLLKPFILWAIGELIDSLVSY